MLTRINEPITESEIEKGSHSNFTNTIKELIKLRKEKLITPVGKSRYKLSYYNAEYIATNYTELAVVCDFRRIIKKVMKQLDTRK